MNLIHEHIAHPEASFRVLRLRQDAFRGGRHRHRHLELTWIERGAGLRHVGDCVQPYEAGDLVLLGPNLPHAWVSGRGRAGQQHEATVLQFAPEVLDTAAMPELAVARGLRDLAGRGLRLPASAAEPVTAALAHLPERTGLSGLSAFVEILARLAACQAAMAPLAGVATRTVLAADTEHDRRIARVIEWVHRHLARPLTVAAAARLVHISPGAFSRWFSRETGKTFTGYINDIRCGEACLRLRSTDKPVAVIAHECGFNTMSNFNRQFRERFGLSPREFRGLG
jgi:AraC-like DNA-binding protein